MRNLQSTLVSTTATFVLSLLGSSADAHDGAEGPSGLLPQGFYEQGGHRLGPVGGGDL